MSAIRMAQPGTRCKSQSCSAVATSAPIQASHQRDDAAAAQIMAWGSTLLIIARAIVTYARKCAGKTLIS